MVRVRFFWAVAVIGGATACTDADLLFPTVDPPPPPEIAPNEIKGQFCTQDPATIVYPMKVWFVIDDSGSMQMNDPNQNRYKKVCTLAMAKADPGHVFFGGEVFSGVRTKVFTSPRFMDDVPMFCAQVTAAQNAGNGDTPYLGALNLAMGEIEADIDANKVLAKRTKYVVIFLSDGIPTDSTPADDIDAVDRLVSLGPPLSAGITLNTVLLGGDDPGAPGLLQQMANHGNGVFKSFPSGDQLNYDGFDFSTVRRTYLQRFFVLTNLSMLPNGKTGPDVDSDGDGLPDFQEMAMGLDPTSRDTDGDGCNDKLEVNMNWDPKAKVMGQCECDPKVADVTKDTDNDGLNDCEEYWLKTTANDPDSDIGKITMTDPDYIFDSLDHYQVNDPTFPDITTDRDLDGFLDREELRMHTSLDVPDVDREKWQYNYTTFEKDPNKDRCYNFVVDNVTLGHTLKTPEHAADENVILMYYVESAADDPYFDTMYTLAKMNVPYKDGNLVLTVDPSQFNIKLGIPMQ
jgi:hypothetical protein